MDQFPEAFLLIDPVQFVQAGAESVSHNTIVGAHHSRKKAKTQDSLPVVVLQAFVIDQRDLFSENGMEHGLVVGLLLFGMGEEEVCFPGDQLFFRYFFDAQQDVAVLKILFYFRSRRDIFFIGVTAIRGSLYDDPYLV